MDEAQKKSDLIEWRLSALETKLDAIFGKIETLRETVMKNACPAPGTCVNVSQNLHRLEAIVEKHETELHQIKLEIAGAKAGGKVITTMAVGLGSIVGAVASLAIQWLSK